MKMTFLNFTPHTITLNDGTAYESVGVARVANTFSDFDASGVCSVEFGDIQGLPEPQEGTLLIVSALVLSAAKAAGSTERVKPEKGNTDCVRKDGFIVSVAGLVRYTCEPSGVFLVSFSGQQNETHI